MEVHQYVCTFEGCTKSFKARKSLVEHMRIHKGEKPYKCHYPGCEKRFTQYSSMQKHERTHTGSKPYKCALCDKEFTQVSNLKRHERVHAGEKPHECDICQKKFSTASNLKQHMHVHEKGDIREKYFCEVCNKMYLYRSSLRKHLQEHEEEGIVLSFKDTNSSTKEGSESGNLFDQAKLEPDFEMFASSEKRQIEIIDDEEEDVDGIFQEPALSKYVFVNEADVIKSSAMESDSQSFMGESLKCPELQQAPSPKDNVFPDSPSAYLYKNDCESKLVSLSPLNDSPLRDFPLLNNYSDYQFLSNRPKATNSIIRYKGELYFLYDRRLNKYKPNGELVIREIENDATNPCGCHHLAEVSHYRDYESLLRVYKEIVASSRGKITMEMLLSEKNCNSLNGSQAHHKCSGKADSDHHDHTQDSEFNPDNFLGSPKLYFQDDFLASEPLEDAFRRAERPTSHNNHVCLCDATRDYKHVHGPFCGHPAIWHDGHIDYIVDGKLHHVDGDHCDDHGPICVVDNAREESAYGLISNIMTSDTKFKPSPLLSDAF